METELDHLRLIFEDKPPEELRRILKRHDNNVQEAVEAILSGETSAADGCSSGDQQRTDDHGNADSTSKSSSIPGPTMAILPPPHFTPTRRVAPTEGLGRTTLSAPPSSRQSVTAEERRRKLLRAQKIAREKEERELQEALRSSMAPSDRGLDYISDEALAQLMNDPVFLASLDDDDLQAAATMQAKLDVAEEEWRALQSEKVASAAQRPDLVSAVSDFSASALHRLAERKRLKALGSSFLRARSTLGIATGQEEQLVEKLEALNRENEQEQQRRKIRLEAKMAMLDAVKEHLESFLAENRNASYEQWIEELHPENAHEGLLLEGLDKTIDHRFYVEESEHLQMWNEMCRSDPNSNRTLVSPRKAATKVGVGGPVDLLSDEPPPLSSETTNSQDAAAEPRRSRPK